MTLRNKIILGFLLLLSLSLLLSGYIFLALEDRRQTRAQELQNTRASEAALQLDIVVLRSINLLQQYVYTRDESQLNELQKSQDLANRFSAVLKESTRSSAVLRDLAEYEKGVAARSYVAEQLIAGVRSGVPPDQLQGLIQERIRLDDKARGHIWAIVDNQQSALEHSVQSGKESYERFAGSLIVALVAYVAAVFVVAIVFGRELSSSLRQLTDMVTSVGQGRLDIRNNIKRKDEIGTLAVTLNRMAAELKMLDDAKEDFISIGTHQLRTPATAVKQYLGLLQEGYVGELDPQQKKIIDNAYASNERQLATIADLLSITQLTAGTLTLKKERTDVKKLLRKIVQDYRPTARGREQKLVLHMPKTEVVARIDGQRLRMVFENLLDNASKYTFAKGSINVYLTNEANQIKVIVEDTGVGISEDHMHRLFQRLSRIPNELSHAVGGTGLGLYLAQQIIELHNGTIEVDSELGKGTKFSVTFPQK